MTQVEEIARLRAALEEIADGDGDPGIMKATLTARAALAVQPATTEPACMHCGDSRIREDVKIPGGLKPCNHCAKSAPSPAVQEAADALADYLKREGFCSCFAEETCEGCRLLTTYFAAKAQAGKESA